METSCLRIRHREFWFLAAVPAAVSLVLAIGMDLSGAPWWLLSLWWLFVLLGSGGLLYVGGCEQVLTPEGITLRQPFFPPRQCRWEDVLQAGVLVGNYGKHPSPMLVITAKGGAPWVETERYQDWQRRNPGTSFELEYTQRTAAFVRQYYGPLDFDMWKKPIKY